MKRALLWRAVSSHEQTEEISLEEQERAEREWAEKNGLEVVGILTVPGESRADADVLSIFEDFAAKGVFAYHDLRRMWQPPRQFDVLVAYHDSRLGRSESLYAYVITNVMRSGAQIYCIIGGWYESDNYRFKMAVGMINVSQEMERFVALTRAAKDAKAAKGELVGNHCWAYMLERDGRGKPIRKVPDETKRSIIETAAQLVIEGVGWGTLERELAERFGILHNGRQFTPKFFYFLFYNPNFWGNEGRAWRQRSLKMVRGKSTAHYSRDLWVFDSSYPTPPETTIWYGVLQPYLTGELAERLKAEMYRRRHMMRGSTRPRNAHKFVGLLRCAYCGNNLVYNSNGRKPIYRCQSKYNSIATDRCTEVRFIYETEVQAWFDTELSEAVSQRTPDYFVRKGNEAELRRHVEQLGTALTRLNNQIDRAMSEQLDADDPQIRSKYRQRIRELQAQALHTEQQLQAIMTKQAPDLSTAHAAYSRLTSYPTLEAFWESGDNNVNQILHGLMISKVLVVEDHNIIGRADRD